MVAGDCKSEYLRSINQWQPHICFLTSISFECSFPPIFNHVVIITAHFHLNYSEKLHKYNPVNASRKVERHQNPSHPDLWGADSAACDHLQIPWLCVGLTPTNHRSKWLYCEYLLNKHMLLIPVDPLFLWHITAQSHIKMLVKINKERHSDNLQHMQITAYIKGGTDVDGHSEKHVNIYRCWNIFPQKTTEAQTHSDKVCKKNNQVEHLFQDKKYPLSITERVCIWETHIV